MSIYCFDIDGVICNIDNDDYEYRTPIKENIKLINLLKDRGDTVILHTGRHINHMGKTKRWLEGNKIKYDLVQFGKPVADFYIDDNAVRYEGKWNKDQLKQLL